MEKKRFRVTADVWSYEPGFGKVPHSLDEIIEATDYKDAQKQAEELLYAKQWQWTPWYKCGDGWEKNRTAQDFTASWLRVDPAD